MSVQLQIDKTAIREQLSRILDSKPFKSSNILSKFLYFIVTETLDGNQDFLKEYVIATNVLNKELNFDPQLDAIVRIHARRLRNHLQDYYTDTGINDPVKITIPKGRYIPAFEKNNTANIKEFDGKKYDLTEVSVKPSIAVLPYKPLPSGERAGVICSVLCQDLCVELSKFHEISLVSDYVVHAAMEDLKNVSDLTNRLAIDYLLTVTCRSGNEDIKVTVELHSILKNTTVWAEVFYIEDFQQEKIKNYNDLIKQVAGIIGGFLGLVYRDTLNSTPPADYDYMYAIYWHNRYHKNFSPEASQKALEAVNKGLKKNPGNSLLYSFKAQLYLDRLAMDFGNTIDYYKEGVKLVTEALELDQNNQHAWQINAWANILNHDKEGFMHSAEKCVAINPNNTMYTGSIGFGYQCAGEYEKGLELMSESIKLNPYYFWNMNIGFCLYYLSHKEYKEALVWAEKINRKGLLWDPLLRACILGLLNRHDEMSKAVDELLALSPDFPLKGRNIVAIYLLDEKLQETIIQGLSLAGIELSVSS